MLDLLLQCSYGVGFIYCFHQFFNCFSNGCLALNYYSLPSCFNFEDFILIYIYFDIFILPRFVFDCSSSFDDLTVMSMNCFTGVCTLHAFSGYTVDSVKPFSLLLRTHCQQQYRTQTSVLAFSFPPHLDPAD